MIENLEDAKEELKRVDHLIFVSLKYTRTADVIFNVLHRMISAYEFLINSLIKQKQENELPETPVERALMLKNLFANDELIQENMKLYLKLRKIVKMSYEKECEYRRHVAITCLLNGEEIKIDIDKVEEYHKLLKELYNRTKATIYEED